MKRSILAGLVILALSCGVENALSQSYSSYPYLTPEATYGNYSYGNYDSYGAGQAYGSPYSYGYDQAYGQQGYYGQNPGQQYGYDQNTGAQSYGQYAPYNPQQTRRRANTQAARPARPQQPQQQQDGVPSVTSNTQVVPASRPALRSVSAEPGPRAQEPLVKQEIYWDGSDGTNESAAQQQGQATQQARVAPQQAAPSRPAVRQQRNTAVSPELQKPQQSRQNVVRQGAGAPPEPSTKSSGLKWGKEEPAQVTQVAPTSKPAALKWGMQEKPAMVGSEPGLNATAQNTNQTNDGGTKKLQWGKSE